MLHYKKFMCKYVNVVLKGDLLGHPFAPNKKLIFGVDDVAAGMVASGLVSGIGSFLSGSSQASAQDRANAANERIAKENREWQSSENALNRSWEEKMWQAQNQYNTPSAMMARYKDAGLNPYLVQKDGSSGIGQASSAGTPSSVAAPNMPNMVASNPLSGLGSLGSAIGTALQVKGVQANVANQNADALLKISQAIPELGKSLGWDNARKVAVDQLKLVGITGSQYERLIDGQIEQYQLQNSMQSIQNKIADKYGDRKAALACDSLEESIKEINARIGKMASDARVNEQSIKTLASEFVRNNASALKMLAETKTIDSLRQYVVGSAKLNFHMLGMKDETFSTLFESEEGIRGYLTSNEYKRKSSKALRDRTVRAADALWSQIMQMLPSVHLGGSLSPGSSGSNTDYIVP